MENILLKLNGYINRKRNEQKMINKFKKIFGNADDVVVCFGDFEQHNHMKYKEPIKGKRIRTLFKKSGYDTYNVVIMKEGDCEKFMIRTNRKPCKN